MQRIVGNILKFMSIIGFLCAFAGLYAEDKPIPPQVRVEVKALEWTTARSLDYGFTVLYTRDSGSGAIIDAGDLTLPSQAALDLGLRAFLDGISISQGDFQVIIEALEQVGNVKVISEPTIVCRVEKLTEKDKYTAEVKTGSKVPYEAAQTVGVSLAEVTRFRDVGVNLRIGVERIIDNEYVQMNVYNSVTNLAGYISVGKNSDGDPMSVPEIYTRTIQNTVIVKDDTILISGVLKTSSDMLKQRGIPWISNIPIIGFFLRDKSEGEKSHELLFLIRPRIMKEYARCLAPEN